MSKEVKLGLAIGGIFLSVILVYILVVSGDPAGTRDQVTLELPAQPVQGEAAGAVVQPEASVTPPVAVEPPTSVEPAGPPAAQPEPAAPEVAHNPATDPWIRLLNEGMPVVTELPQPEQTPEPTAIAQGPAAVGPVALPDANPPAAQPERMPPASDTPRTHVIQSGETFSSISSAVYGSSAYFAHLIRANPDIDPKKLRPGMVVKIPPISEVRADTPSGTDLARTLDDRTEYRVQGGDSLYKISMKLYGKPDRQDKLYEANKATIGADKAKLRVGAILKLPEAPTVASR